MVQSEVEIAKGSELVFALVGPLGTDLESVSQKLEDALKSYDYGDNKFKLSEFIRQSPSWDDSNLGKDNKYDEYITRLQDGGNKIRKEYGNDVLVILAIARIRDERWIYNKNNPKREFKSEADYAKYPKRRCAYILSSLKHPDEVKILRKIYGSGFFLISAYSPIKDKVEFLTNKIYKSHSEDTKKPDSYKGKAYDLIERDKYQSEDFGQKVRDTFHMADLFVNASNESELKESIDRFVDLLFRYPYHTPSKAEYAMFHAQAAALRSGDLSRQVGAAIVTDDGDIVTVGANEVPKVGGGSYWPEDKDTDYRDYNRGGDSNTVMKHKALREVLEKFRKAGWFNKNVKDRSQSDLEREAIELLEGTKIREISDFGRSVHAEMSALLCAARRGFSVKDLTLYTTTFPCQNCAKHIIEAGITKVIYIEPYSKSYATELHDKEILVDDNKEDDSIINFNAYIGVAPRRFLDLFTMTKRKHANGSPIIWNDEIKKNQIPRFPDDRAVFAYVERETDAIRRIVRL